MLVPILTLSCSCRSSCHLTMPPSLLLLGDDVWGMRNEDYKPLHFPVDISYARPSVTLFLFKAASLWKIALVHLVDLLVIWHFFSGSKEEPPYAPLSIIVNDEQKVFSELQNLILWFFAFQSTWWHRKQIAPSSRLCFLSSFNYSIFLIVVTLHWRSFRKEDQMFPFMLETQKDLYFGIWIRVVSSWLISMLYHLEYGSRWEVCLTTLFWYALGVNFKCRVTVRLREKMTSAVWTWTR